MSRIRVVVRPAAAADINDIAEYLETARPGSGSKFRFRVRRMLDVIEMMPRMYAKLRGTVRAARVGRFHYILFYRIRRTEIDVFAVIHSSRSPAAWLDRI